mgnify:CR=1 FL=1
MNFNQALEFFVEEMERQNKSANTIKNYLSDLRDFDRFVSSQPLWTGDDLLPPPQNVFKTYTEFLKKSGLAKSTVNRRIQSLKTFYATLHEKGVIDDNPTENLRMVKVAKQNETRWLERHQVKAIFDAIDKIKQGEDKHFRDRAIISVLVNCGLRVQELCDVKMGDIDWDAGLISVVGKGGKFRRVPFNPATQKAVQLWLKFRNKDSEYLFHTERSDRMTARAVQHLAKKLSERLNFEFTVHQLRHTALKNIADTTGKIEIVASVAGHDNVNTSKRYIEPSLAEIGEAMKKSEYDF